MRRLGLILMVVCAGSAAGESRYGSDFWRIYLEFDQMLVLKVGAEYSLSPSWGVKGSLGISVFGLTTVGYQMVGVYHITGVDSGFQCAIEFGLPIAYFNVLEGNLVDWDPYIDDPFAGWAPGATVVWGLKLGAGPVLSLKTGAVVLFEYQRDSGWRDNVPVLPAAALQVMF